MRSLLILFMTAGAVTGGLGLTTARAGAIYGFYTGAAYLMCLPGGWLADRLLGQRRAVLLGGCIIAAGNFSLAIKGLAHLLLRPGADRAGHRAAQAQRQHHGRRALP